MLVSFYNCRLKIGLENALLPYSDKYVNKLSKKKMKQYSILPFFSSCSHVVFRYLLNISFLHDKK